MLKALAESVFRTGLSGVQSRQSTVKTKRGDKSRGPRRLSDYAPTGKGTEDAYSSREGPKTGTRTSGNKQFIQGTGSRSGKSGGTGRLVTYRERGKGGRTTRDRDRGTRNK